MKQPISVIIPTYNNKKQLIKNLKHNLQYLKSCEIIVVNDYPHESIAQDLKELKRVTLTENTNNKGFAGTMNEGARHASAPYLLFLNDDVILQDNSYIKAEEQFKTDPSLFAVAFAQREKDGTMVGKNRLFWKNGFVQHSKAHDLHAGINGWAEGGASLIDARKFKELGGFDERFAPFYWEDIDLSYRAWEHGYPILFNPEIIVQHHHESTIGAQFQKTQITTIAYRNQFLFIWKHIASPQLRLSHVLHLLYYVLINSEMRAGFFAALSRQLPFVGQNKKLMKKRDVDILSFFT